MMGRPRKDNVSIFVRTPRHLAAEIERIAIERAVSRQTVVLDALTAQLEIETPNIFKERTPPAPAE
jgi:hypothetical protein